MNDTNIIEDTLLLQTNRTFCRNCGSSCGLLIETEGNRITTVSPDRHHPMTQGYMCVKGLMSGDLQNGDGRLLEARKRAADGSSRVIDVKIALDEIAERLTSIVDEHGPRALALYFGTGVKFNTLGSMALRAWLSATGSPYLYSSSTIDQSAKWVTMGRMGVFEPGKHVIHETDLMLIVGSNPPISHQGLPVGAFPSFRPQTWIRQAKARGARLIVVDPRCTELARDADIHLQALPGEDVSLLAGLINVILTNGWEDRAFCDRFVTSLDRLRETVRPFTPEYAAKRAGVDAQALREAAEIFAKSKRRSAWSGTGPNMSTRSNLSEHLIEALNAVCGVYRRAGDKIRNIGSFSPRGDVFERVRPPNRTWENEPKLWTQDTGMLGGEFPSSRIPDEILEGGLRALIVVGGNLATALGQTEKTLSALKSLDLLVTLDPRLTETAALSDYALPTKLPYERYDGTQLFDGFFMETFAQVSKPIVEAPPGVLDDWEVFWGLSRRMGLPLSLAEYKWGGGGAASDVIVDMETKPTSYALIREVCSRGRLTLDELFDHPEGVLSKVDPIIIKPSPGDDGARLDVCPPDVAEQLGAVRNEIIDRSVFPFRLSVRRMRETMNSAFRDADATRRRWPYNPAFMNPADMDVLGLQEADPVEITSDTGTIIGCATRDPTVRQGVVSMPHQWGSQQPGDVTNPLLGDFTGRLVSLDRDLADINYMPRQSGIPVRLRRRTQDAEV